LPARVGGDGRVRQYIEMYLPTDTRARLTSELREMVIEPNSAKLDEGYVNLEGCRVATNWEVFQ